MPMTLQCSDEDSRRYGSPTELDAVTRKLAKKLSDLSVTREEYIMLKAMLLLNPGQYSRCDLLLA